MSLNPAHAKVYSMQHYVIKFIIDLWQVCDFLKVLPISSTNKTGRHDITEILLKVTLSTITLTVNLLFLFSLLDIVSSANQDSYVKLVVSSLNFSNDNNTRHVLAKALCSASEVQYLLFFIIRDKAVL